MATKQLSDRIISDPRILGGKPTIQGTRVSVELILENLAEAPDDVKACLEYAQKLVEEQKKHLVQAQL